MLLVAVATAMSFTTFSQENKKGQFAPSYFPGTLTQANEFALNNERNFLIVLYDNEEDGLLKFFNEELLADSVLVQLLNDEFVCFYENKDSKNGKLLVSQYAVTQFPIILFVSTQGEQLHEIVAKLDPDQMQDELIRKVIND